MDITVIVATKNSARFLATALQSVRDQADLAVDLVVVDANSTDQSSDIAHKFGARVIVQEGTGLGAAWNLGIASARAPNIAFLDSDDRWVENTLSERIRALPSGENPAISLGKVLHVLEPGTPMPARHNPTIFVTESFAPIPGTLVIPRPIFDRIGMFDTSFVISSDVDWIGRAKAAGYPFCPVDRLVLIKRVHGANLTLTEEGNSLELIRALRNKVMLARSFAGMASAARQNRA